MKPKANISLLNISELKSSGIFLSLRKGINELKNRNKPSVNPCKAQSELTFYPKKLSVIICTSNKNDLSKRAVNSVLSQDIDRDKYEIIVVNNSDKAYPYTFNSTNIHVVNEPKTGLSIARNIGAATAKGEYLLYIDDDAVANENLLISMYNAFESHSAAIIGGQIYLNLPTPTPEVFISGKESIWSGYTVSYKKYKEINEHYEFPYGACFGIRHSVLDALGGFPEDYGRCGNNFAGGEETALCFSAKNNGYKLAIEPAASVNHCVLPERFTKEHIQKTIREGILTTYRLYCDGYAPNGWTLPYIEERIRIIEKELVRLTDMPLFYKKCEYDAFSELKNIINKD